jgi:hypothetical protein
MRGILTVVMLSQQMGLRNQWVNVKVLEKVLPFILHGLVFFCCEIVAM